MSEKGLTTIHLKKINRAKVYHYIYRKKELLNSRLFKNFRWAYLLSAKT